MRRTGPRPDRARVGVEAGRGRVGEGEAISVRVRVVLPTAVGRLSVTLLPGLPLLGWDNDAEHMAIDTDHLEADYLLRPARWGRWSLGRVRVSAHHDGGLLHATLDVGAAAGRLPRFGAGRRAAPAGPAAPPGR